MPRGCLARVTSGVTGAAVGHGSNSVNKLGKGWQQSSKQFVALHKVLGKQETEWIINYGNLCSGRMSPSGTAERKCSTGE